MSIEKVELERNNKHACTGLVMSCEETGRTIASFWHDYDAEDAMLKINKHDQLVKALKDFDAYCQNDKGYFNSPFESEVNRLLASIEET